VKNQADPLQITSGEYDEPFLDGTSGSIVHQRMSVRVVLARITAFDRPLNRRIELAPGPHHIVGQTDAAARRLP
jgi:hypothetical protein